MSDDNLPRCHRPARVSLHSDDDANQPVCGVERVAGEERGEKRGNAHHHKRPSSLFILQTIQTLFLVIP